MNEKSLRAYQLSEDLSPQQPFIDRAEEDLLCAVYLYRRGICGGVPRVVICFLLHQAAEKWLRAFLAITGLQEPHRNKRHELSLLFDRSAKKEPELEAVKEKIKGVDEEILEQSFPGDLRYGEFQGNIKKCIKVLIWAVFRIRRLVKKWVARREES